MRPAQKIGLLVFIVFALIGSDQTTKILAQRHLESSPPISLFGGVFRLIYAENPGAFLSLGSGLSETTRFWLFTVIVGTFLIGLLFYTLLNPRLIPTEVFSLALVFGGGISNLVDRVLRGHKVIDFMIVGVGEIHTGVFNVADVAITAGVGLLFWAGLRSSRRQASQRRSFD
ncbi:MAG: signal peptidase II [Nitrospirae bacterium]|nr:signal peptidase II [Candidatus Manganitrophaceae bacterium]